jgi:hypothetical protein
MAKVLDFNSERKERVEQKRRSFERVVFKNFLGSYSVIDNAGSIYEIEMVDISKTGCLFQVPWNVQNDKKFEKGKEINLRMYFSQKTYLPIIVKVKYGNEYLNDKGHTYMQYGCEFDTTTHSYAALKSFIDFLYNYADLSVDEKGDTHQVFFL